MKLCLAILLVVLQLCVVCRAEENKSIGCDYYISIHMENVIKNTNKAEATVKRVSFDVYDEKYYHSNISYPSSDGMNSLFDQESADLLCNDSMIKEMAKEFGIINVERIERYFWYSYINGFVVKIFDEYEQVYFLCILRDGNKYGLFENMKIYKYDDFLSLCINKEWKMQIDGLECNIDAEFEKKYIPLRILLESVGCDVVWNPQEKAVEFGDFKVLMQQTNGEYYLGRIYFNDKPYGSPSVYPSKPFVLKNDRFYFFETATGSFDIFLEDAFNITRNIDKDNMTIEYKSNKGT